MSSEYPPQLVVKRSATIVEGGGWVERRRIARREPEADRARVVYFVALAALWTGGALLYWASFGLGWLVAYVLLAGGVLTVLGVRIARLAKRGSDATVTDLVPRWRSDAEPLDPRNLY